MIQKSDSEKCYGKNCSHGIKTTGWGSCLQVWEVQVPGLVRLGVSWWVGTECRAKEIWHDPHVFRKSADLLFLLEGLFMFVPVALLPP